MYAGIYMITVGIECSYFWRGRNRSVSMHIFLHNCSVVFMNMFFSCVHCYITAINLNLNKAPETYTICPT